MLCVLLLKHFNLIHIILRGLKKNVTRHFVVAAISDLKPMILNVHCMSSELKMYIVYQRKVAKCKRCA